MHLWPQITMLALVAIGFGVSLARFGEQRRDTYDWTDLIVGPALILTILYCGGFFTPMGF